MNRKEHALNGILHIPKLHVHPSVVLILWISAQPEKRFNLLLGLIKINLSVLMESIIKSLEINKNTPLFLPV